MRIRGGSHRGRKLVSPKGDVRPTPDIMRQAYFQITAEWLEDGDFVDVFAGGGSMGIEALSRGAPGAVFVERDPGRIRVIRTNLETFEFERRATVWSMDAFRCADRLEGRAIGLAWLAPPYRFLEDVRAHERLAELVAALARRTSGPVAVQVSTRAPLEPAAGIEILEVRRYGNNAIQLFRVQASPDVSDRA